mgnify:CR=1 FL=1
MKQRIKKLLSIGAIIAIITTVTTLSISFFTGNGFNIIRVSNVLFIEFLLLLSLSILILFKEQFVFKNKNSQEKEKNKDQAKNSTRLNSSLEFLLIALPLLVISALIILI